MTDPNPYRPTPQTDTPPPRRRKGLLEFSPFERFVGFTTLAMIGGYVVYRIAVSFIV